MWTADKVANLARVRDLASLPFETSLVLFMKEEDVIVTDQLADQIGERHRVRLPAVSIVERGCEINKTRQVIVVHNHPTGDDPVPSDWDLAGTEEYKAMLAEVGIELLDHIVVSQTRYFSFRANGLL